MDVHEPVAVPVGRIFFDAGWRAVYANAGANALLGVDGLLGRTESEIIRPSRVAPHDATSPALFPASRFRLLRVAEARLRGFLLNYAAQGDGYVLTFEPAEWSLGFLDQVDTGIATTDEQGVIVYTNRALSELLGFAPPDVLGQSVERIAAAIALRPSDAHLVSTVAAQGRTLTDSFPAHLPGRSGVMLHIHTAEWRYQGVPCGLIWSARDDTETEDAKRQEAVAFGYRLAALLQHELRNPLQTIQAAVEILRPLQPPAAVGALRMLEQQVRLISEYLAEQLQPPAPTSMSRQRLSAVVAEEIERSQMRLSTGRLTFRHHPPEHEPLVGMHVGALGRAFANLFRNAAQVRPDACVDIRYTVGPDAVACVVTDDGPGFPPGILSGHWLTPVGGGLEHLGLVVVTSTVQAHGGSVLMENAAGGGARVTVALPLAGVDAAAATRVEHTP